MTNEEAILILRNNKPTNDTRLCGKELCEAIDRAIKALEKQILKVPKRKLCCPTCGSKAISEFAEYCPDCGQFLDWGELD